MEEYWAALEWACANPDDREAFGAAAKQLRKLRGHGEYGCYHITRYVAMKREGHAVAGTEFIPMSTTKKAKKSRARLRDLDEANR